MSIVKRLMAQPSRAFLRPSFRMCRLNTPRAPNLHALSAARGCSRPSVAINQRKSHNRAAESSMRQDDDGWCGDAHTSDTATNCWAVTMTISDAPPPLLNSSQYTASTWSGVILFLCASSLTRMEWTKVTQKVGSQQCRVVWQLFYGFLLNPKRL